MPCWVWLIVGGVGGFAAVKLTEKKKKGRK